MRYLLVLAILARAASTTLAGDGTQAVTFILDCSASMSAKMQTDEQVVRTSAGGGDSRLDVARDAIREALDKLSIDGDHRVGLILFGHRLAWQQGVSEPDLMEQTRYLEQTLGFEVLKDLVPGDDVEIVRHVSRFEPRDFAQLEGALNVLEPWGEEPLYLALAKAVETFDRTGQSEKRVIVITDGGNNHGMAKQPTSRDRVLEAIDRRPVPVHIFRIGDEELSRQSEAELGQIARRSGGDYVTLTSADELRAKIQLALAVKASRPARRETTATTTAATAASMIATAQATDETTAELVKSAVATIKSTVPVPEEAKLSRLQGSVSYYGMPAKKAKLILEGEASQIVLRADNQGNFSVENVEPGIYTLSTEAVVKNTFRYASRKLKIDHSGGTKTIDLGLQ
jgi:hypothetical protein